MTSPVRAPRPTPRRAPRALPEVDRRSHLRIVPPAGRQQARRRRTGAVLVAAMVLVFGSLMASAIFHGLLAGGQTNLDKLDAQLQEERTSLAREKLELAHLRSPQRIAEAATEMGMVPAETQHWVSAATGDQTIVSRDDATSDDGGGDPTTDTDETDDGTTNELAGSTGTEAP